MRNHHSLHRCVLKNGITLLCAENPVADLVAGRIFLKQAGACWDPPHHVGLSHLVASVITRGTGHYSALEIAETIESLGAQLHTGAANDYWSLSLKAITSDFSQLLTLAADILCSPTFPDSEIELEKRLILQALQSQQEQPFNLAFQKLFN